MCSDDEWVYHLGLDSAGVFVSPFPILDSLNVRYKCPSKELLCPDRLIYLCHGTKGCSFQESFAMQLNMSFAVNSKVLCYSQ